MVGQVQRAGSTFLTSVPSSRRYAEKLGHLSLISQARLSPKVERAHAPFWIPPSHCSTEDFVFSGFTSRRTQWLLSIATESITMRRGIRTRTHPLNST